METAEFEGREFDWETRNCYSLVRDFYSKVYGIDLAPYACPQRWWDHGLDLYATLAPQEGFHLVSGPPTDWLPGDVIVMAIDSQVGNHVGILLHNGKILHHLVSCLSAVTQYGGLFRNNTVAVYRHPKVCGKTSGTQTLNFMELLSPHVRRRLEEKLANTGS